MRIFLVHNVYIIFTNTVLLQLQLAETATHSYAVMYSVFTHICGTHKLKETHQQYPNTFTFRQSYHFNDSRSWHILVLAL